MLCEKYFFIYINVNYNYYHQKNTTCIYKKQNKLKRLYTKIQTLHKNQDNLRYISYTKSPTLYGTRFFMKILKLAFIYKKHDTLRCVNFLYSKSQTLCTKKTICVTYLCTKAWHFPLRDFSWNFWNRRRGGGGIFVYKKNALCVTFVYSKNNLLCVTFVYTKILTLCVTFVCAKNNALCVTFLYVNFIL